MRLLWHVSVTMLTCTHTIHYGVLAWDIRAATFGDQMFDDAAVLWGKDRGLLNSAAVSPAAAAGPEAAAEGGVVVDEATGLEKVMLSTPLVRGLRMLGFPCVGFTCVGVPVTYES